MQYNKMVEQNNKQIFFYMDNLKIKIILGSTREGRFGDKAAQWILELAKKKEELDVELLDLRDYAMPFFNEAITPSSIKEPYTNEAVARWTKKIAEADGFIIATAEYSHGYPAVLKNALDYVYKEWNQKPVGFVAWGGVGGARSVEQLRAVAIELQMAPMRNAVHIVAPWFMVDEKGILKPGALDAYANAAEGMLSQLIWWTKALKSARG
jgi:NAD(P)H-dependent FMN reductase